MQPNTVLDRIKLLRIPVSVCVHCYSGRISDTHTVIYRCIDSHTHTHRERHEHRHTPLRRGREGAKEYTQQEPGVDVRSRVLPVLFVCVCVARCRHYLHAHGFFTFSFSRWMWISRAVRIFLVSTFSFSFDSVIMTAITDSIMHKLTEWSFRV